MPAVGRLWPSDDYDNDYDDGGGLVDHRAADLLQGELAHIVEEELEGGEQGHEEDHDGDEEGNCNQH